jgi:hypothetical protein
MSKQQTTARAVVSPGGSEGRARFVVRWLYPEEQTSLVGDGPAVFGRGGEGSVTLQGAELSRRHAELRREGPFFVVRDLGSTNGTFVNGLRVAEAPLGLGDVLRLGDCVGMLGLTKAEDPVPVFAELAPAWTSEVGEHRPARLVAEVTCRSSSKERRHRQRGRAGHSRLSGRPKPSRLICRSSPPGGLGFGYRRGPSPRIGIPGSSHGRWRHSLDEIADLSLKTQAKLLRVIGSGKWSTRQALLSVSTCASSRLQKVRHALCGSRSSDPISTPDSRA